ncbi:hypothetical protein HanPSC8_Chr03g0107531 [Helianthus annuus]|nr:hypothetical protein HanPSC8_Chr03g0107531 [Helianthus annuus]
MGLISNSWFIDIENPSSPTLLPTFFFFHHKMNASIPKSMIRTNIPATNPTTSPSLFADPLFSSTCKVELLNIQDFTVFLSNSSPAAAENPKTTHSGNASRRSTV